MPKSWKHYVYGSAFLRRQFARDSLQIAGATAISQATNEDYRAWRRDMLMMAGFQE